MIASSFEEFNNLNTEIILMCFIFSRKFIFIFILLFCNKHFKFVFSDSVWSSVITCPSSLQFNLSATIQSAECTGSTIHGAVTTSQHTYSYASCVTNKYTCKHFVHLPNDCKIDERRM